MVYEYKFPDVGEGITEGKLVKWTVNVGDTIKVDDTVADVETDKAVVHIPAPVGGTVAELKNKEGDTLNVGEVIMTINEGGEAPAEPEQKELHEVGNHVEAQEEASEPKQEEPKVETPEPEPEPVQEEPTPAPEPTPQPQPVQQAPPPSSSESHSEPSSGVLAMPNVRHIAKEKNIDLSTVKGTGKHGQITLEDVGGAPEGSAPVQKNVEPPKPLTSEPEPQSESQVRKPEPTPQPETNTGAPPPIEAPGDEIIASPSVRQLARELGVNINEVKGSGDNGRILESDLKNFKPGESHEDATRAPPQEHAPAPQPEAKATQVLTDDKVVPLSNIRKIIGSRMVESLQKAPQVTHSDEANITRLVNLRNAEKEKLKEQGVKLTYLPFIMKAFVATAREFPMFNAVVDGDNVIQKPNFDIAIATDTPNGLLVPVVRGCEGKSIVQLAKDVVDITGKARDGSLPTSEMSGSTFTISSVGSLGGQVFTPIINYPEVCILGVGKIIKKVIVEHDQMVIADMVTFSLTFDHRIVDGADAARFLKKFIEYIEDPDLLFLGGAS